MSKLSKLFRSSKNKNQPFYTPEELVINTLECFGLTEEVKHDSSKVNELKKFAPRIENYLFPKISNQKIEVQLSLL